MTYSPWLRSTFVASTVRFIRLIIFIAAGRHCLEPAVRVPTRKLSICWKGRYATPLFAAPVSLLGRSGWCARRKTRYGSVYSADWVSAVLLRTAASIVEAYLSLNSAERLRRLEKMEARASAAVFRVTES
jgi:hypothetical protein